MVFAEDQSSEPSSSVLLIGPLRLGGDGSGKVEAGKGREIWRRVEGMREGSRGHVPQAVSLVAARFCRRGGGEEKESRTLKGPCEGRELEGDGRGQKTTGT